MTSSPLQNRVQPNGEIVATNHRGLFYGNRGGKIHDSKERKLHPTRRWATRQWICCVLQFKGRKRPLMGAGYTELFFLDEVTALAAGHRPCFECRCRDALLFANAWSASGTRTPAPQMDRTLHGQRLDGRDKRVSSVRWQDLPNGAMVQINHHIIAKSKNGPLLWSHSGYQPIKPAILPRANQFVDCLTPPAILVVLANGYQPIWHPSANLD